MVNPTPENRVYTYVYTYMKKRRREEEKEEKRTNVVFYDKDKLLKLQEICLREGTDVSSVVSNIVDVLVSFFDEKPLTLDKYLDPDYVPTPEITDDIEKTIAFLLKQNNDFLKALETKFYQAYVYSVAFQQMTPKERAEQKNNYVYLYQKFVRH